jgi:hypothetical protein
MTTWAVTALDAVGAVRDDRHTWFDVPGSSTGKGDSHRAAGSIESQVGHTWVGRGRATGVKSLRLVNWIAAYILEGRAAALSLLLP